MSITYPFRVSKIYPYTDEERRKFLPYKATEEHKNSPFTESGDLTNETVYFGVRQVHERTLFTVAYLDVMDERQKAMESDLENLKHDMRAVRLDLQDLQNTLNAIVDFMGAIVPNWTTKLEILEGDDMGMNVESAEALGLNVEYVIFQNEPGYEHEQVVEISPLPGTLVAKGSTVKIWLNMTG